MRVSVISYGMTFVMNFYNKVRISFCRFTCNKKRGFYVIFFKHVKNCFRIFTGAVIKCKISFFPLGFICKKKSCKIRFFNRRQFFFLPDFATHIYNRSGLRLRLWLRLQWRLWLRISYIINNPCRKTDARKNDYNCQNTQHPFYSFNSFRGKFFTFYVKFNEF